VQACICAGQQEKAIQPQTLSALTALAAQIYARTGLTQQELRGETIATMLAKLNERFCDRLGISPDSIAQGHASILKMLHQTPSRAE
jgi:hypothetical protein